jgi:hypothetical protein
MRAMDHARNVLRVQLSILPADLAALDAIAAALAEPGLAPNRSAALRYLIRCQEAQSRPELPRPRATRSQSARRRRRA